LEDLVRALEARQAQVGELVASARRTQAAFEGLRATAEQVLHHLHGRGGAEAHPPGGNGAGTWPAAAPPFPAPRAAGGGGGRLPAAGVVPRRPAGGARPDARPLPRRPAPAARARAPLPAPLDRPAVRPARAAVRPARRARGRLLRQPPGLTTFPADCVRGLRARVNAAGGREKVTGSVVDRFCLSV